MGGGNVDRADALVHRDNNSSIVIWSLGNEAFYGCNQNAMYSYISNLTPAVPFTTRVIPAPTLQTCSATCVHLSSASSSSHKKRVRIGFNLGLDKALDKVEWYGRGPDESYPDKNAARRMSIWTKDSVADMEDGNWARTRWVKLTSRGAHTASSGIRACALAMSLISTSWLHTTARRRCRRRGTLWSRRMPRS